MGTQGRNRGTVFLGATIMSSGGSLAIRMVSHLSRPGGSSIRAAQPREVLARARTRRSTETELSQIGSRAGLLGWEVIHKHEEKAMTPVANSGQRHADLIVVGGGLAGLSAAALVARAGRSVVVLERSKC